jgi:hypothetical protein
MASGLKMLWQSKLSFWRSTYVANDGIFEKMGILPIFKKEDQGMKKIIIVRRLGVRSQQSTKFCQKLRPDPSNNFQTPVTTFDHLYLGSLHNDRIGKYKLP